MPIKRITSRDNPFFRELLDLAESRRARRERMQTILDGEHLLTEAIQAGVAPVHIVVTEALVERAAWEPAGWLEKLPQVPITQMPASLFNRLSPVATPSGILSVIGIPVPERCPDPQFAVLLEDIQEPGNLGALLRTAAAAGVEAVYLSKGCAEAWSPKALRGGQGGHFRLRIVEGADLSEVAAAFNGAVYAAALRSGTSLYDLPLAEPVAFVFGNEGAGLSDELLAGTRAFSIPMAGKVESLNVAAASAVCLFERVRQRSSVQVRP